MVIPRSYIENYSQMLNDIIDQGRAVLVNALNSLDYGRDIATVRKDVVAIMQMCCGATTTMAERLAADFYDELRARFGISDGFTATVDSGREPTATEGAVRAFAQDLVDEKPIAQFVGKCADRLDYETRLASNKCVEQNARRDPKKPRWARVPTGFETCTFCIMLASRGFVYHTEETASHAHAHCDCRVVPSWDTKAAIVEGYDPDYYLRIWQRLNDAEVIHDRLYDETPSEVRSKCEEINASIGRAWNQYSSSAGTAASYQSSVGRVVRDLSASGRLSVEDHTDLKRKGHEPQLGAWLADAGHNVLLRTPRGDDTSDAVIDDEIWEFKRLTTKSTKKFRRRITEKIPRQGPNFVVDLSAGGLERRLAEHIIVDLLEDEFIEKIMLVKDGSAKVFKK